MFLEKNYLMIGNTRWHWATKIKENCKYFHTTPNPIEFKDKKLLFLCCKLKQRFFTISLHFLQTSKTNSL